MKLTEKQRRFVDYYVETGNASEAARRAGYAEKAAYRTGSENLRKPQVKAAIDARLKELEDKRIAKADEVMQFLTSALRGEPPDVDEREDRLPKARRPVRVGCAANHQVREEARRVCEEKASGS